MFTLLAPQSRGEDTQSEANVIITFADETKVPATESWYKYLDSLGYTEHIIIATDRPTFLHFTKNCSFRTKLVQNYSPDVLPLEVLKKYIDAKYNVLMVAPDTIFTHLLPLNLLRVADVVFLDGPSLIRPVSTPTNRELISLTPSWWSHSVLTSTYLSRLLSACKNIRCDVRSIINSDFDKNVIWYPSSMRNIRRFAVSSTTGMLFGAWSRSFAWIGNANDLCPPMEKLWIAQLVHEPSVSSQARATINSIWQTKCNSI
jgi:hypothetical protein